MDTTTPAALTAPAAPAAAAAPAPSARSAPSIGRRAALAVTTLLTAVLPVVWGLGSAADLLAGKEPDHRFHQVTGQGLLLSALWLGALLPLIVAGWRSRVPSASAGVAHLGIALGVVVAAILAPVNGGAVLAVVVVVTGGLLWSALPARPPVRAALSTVRIDPLLAPVGLLTAALLTPYLLHQAALQRAMADEHARMSHYFDMAWLSSTVIVFALLAAALPSARRLVLPTAGALLVLGAAGVAFLSSASWPFGALALGLAAALVGGLRTRGTAGRRF